MNHGTLQAYIQDGCRCDECRRYRVRWQKQYLYDVSHGRPRMVPAAPAQQHLRGLVDQGMSWNAVTKAGGWKSRNSLTELMRRHRINPRLEARVLAITPDADTRPTAYVDKAPSRYRLQALARLGWGARELAAESGIGADTLGDIRRNDIPAPVRRATHDRIHTLFNELWNTPGRSERTRRWAARHGFLLPLDLDDDGLPLPDAAVGGCATCDEVVFLRSTGAGDDEVAARLGLSHRHYLTDHLRRHQPRGETA